MSAAMRAPVALPKPLRYSIGPAGRPGWIRSQACTGDCP
jgi:hypothetical protein